MQNISKLKRIKKKRLLTLTAGGMHSGIGAIYFETNDKGWEILSQAFIPYTKDIQDILGTIYENQRQEISLDNLGFLDRKISQLIWEGARTTMAQAPAKRSTPHLVILGKFILWKGTVGQKENAYWWNISLGDAQVLATTLNAPVLTDLIRHDIYKKKCGTLPVTEGYIRFAGKNAPAGIFVNIGLVSRIIIHNPDIPDILFDSDTGPGTCLINHVARDLRIAEDFDRDGSLASQGTIDNDCLAALAASDCLTTPAPKKISAADLYPLLDFPCIQQLAPPDRLATITALTARSIFDFYKRESPLKSFPECIWLSGGGVHNQSLVEYLTMHFDPIPIRSIEKLGIAPDLGMTLALGLTIAAYLNNEIKPNKNHIFTKNDLGFGTIIWP